MCDACYGDEEPAHDPRAAHYPRPLLALTEACRQTQREAKLLPFSLNRFSGDLRTWEMVLDVYHCLPTDCLNAIASIRMMVSPTFPSPNPTRNTPIPDRISGFSLLRTWAGLTGLKKLTMRFGVGAQDDPDKAERMLVDALIKQLETVGFTQEWEIRVGKLSVSSADRRLRSGESLAM